MLKAMWLCFVINNSLKLCFFVLFLSKFMLSGILGGVAGGVRLVVVIGTLLGQAGWRMEALFLSNW